MQGDSLLSFFFSSTASYCLAPLLSICHGVERAFLYTYSTFHCVCSDWSTLSPCLLAVVMQSGETSSLKTLLQMGIPDKDYLFKVHSLTPTDGFVNTGQLVTTIGAVDNLCTVNSSESKNSSE